MPVLSCVCTTQNYTNTVMNLPEVSRSQSPSSPLTNKVEATAYVDFLKETGYKRLADGNIQALQAQLPQHLSKICTWCGGGDQRLVSKREDSWANLHHGNCGRVVISVKVICTITVAKKTWAPYLPFLPPKMSILLLGMQLLGNYTTYVSLMSCCEGNGILYIHQPHWFCMFINLRTWIFEYGHVAARSQAGGCGFRIRDCRI